MIPPSKQGYYMPAEWEPHTRCWMMWPCRQSLWKDHLEAARQTTAEVANAIAQFEPVTMVTQPANVAEVSLHCGIGVHTLSLPHDDSWMRDIAPSFVLNPAGEMAAVRWRFNAWGLKYLDFEQDAAIPLRMSEHLKVSLFEAPLVNEGGAISLDGEGTVLSTESVLLDPKRNPGMTKEEIEHIFAGYIGAQKVIWLKEGLVEDYTNGHVDEIACFIGPGRVLAQVTSDTSDANYDILKENVERLRAATDAKGRPLQVLTVEQPAPRYDQNGTRLSLSYVNFYIANGGVVMPAYEDAHDKRAFDVISRAFPDRKVIQIPALDLYYGGGGIHCITHQQPTPKNAASQQG